MNSATLEVRTREYRGPSLELENDPKIIAAREALEKHEKNLNALLADKGINPSFKPTISFDEDDIELVETNATQLAQKDAEEAKKQDTAIFESFKKDHGALKAFALSIKGTADDLEKLEEKKNELRNNYPAYLKQANKTIKEVNNVQAQIRKHLKNQEKIQAAEKAAAAAKETLKNLEEQLKASSTGPEIDPAQLAADREKILAANKAATEKDNAATAAAEVRNFYKHINPDVKDEHLDKLIELGAQYQEIDGKPAVVFKNTETGRTTVDRIDEIVTTVDSAEETREFNQKDAEQQVFSALAKGWKTIEVKTQDPIALKLIKAEAEKYGLDFVDELGTLAKAEAKKKQDNDNTSKAKAPKEDAPEEKIPAPVKNETHDIQDVDFEEIKESSNAVIYEFDLNVKDTSKNGAISYDEKLAQISKLRTQEVRCADALEARMSIVNAYIDDFNATFTKDRIDFENEKICLASASKHHTNKYLHNSIATKMKYNVENKITMTNGIDEITLEKGGFTLTDEELIDSFFKKQKVKSGLGTLISKTFMLSKKDITEAAKKKEDFIKFSQERLNDFDVDKETVTLALTGNNKGTRIIPSKELPVHQSYDDFMDRFAQETEFLDDEELPIEDRKAKIDALYHKSLAKDELARNGYKKTINGKKQKGLRHN